ncbi:hypothetical protein FZC84_16740 [Rossellomorea vietnamensis]|uniref:Uncharacterized protein n=1 Tax=Rossellomorea vietnamensis TaxID=218284 RepID=A0A5D4M8N9_9BACI|nr:MULTISPECIES: hypothetical protein [Bacillaceae]TYR98032.1 hypothetical protein FZC84_16740 [Rossellomorea vietnamensis]
MNINEFSRKEQEILTCIDKYIEKAHQQSNQPVTIRKNDIENYVESEAERLSIPYEKNSTSVQTYYIFFLDQQKVQVEIFYRYQSYYTRHSITNVH